MHPFGHSGDPTVIKTILCVTLISLLPFTVTASDVARPVTPPTIADPIVQQRPALAFNIRAGAGAVPAYFGADHYLAVIMKVNVFEFGSDFPTGPYNSARWSSGPSRAVRITSFQDSLGSVMINHTSSARAGKNQRTT